MTYEEKVQWLQRYQLEMQREKELVEELVQLRNRATAIEAHIDDIPKRKTNSDIILTAVASIIEAEKRLGDQIIKCSQIRSKTIETITSVSKEREQLILRYRYIVGLGWEKIAEKIKICPKWCKTLHDKAIEGLEISGRGGDD